MRRTILIESAPDQLRVRITFLRTGHPVAFIFAGNPVMIGEVVDNWMSYDQLPEGFHRFTLQRAAKL